MKCAEGYSKWIARFFFAHCGTTAGISHSARFKHPRKITLGDRVTIREQSLLSAEGTYLRMGNDCYIDRNVLISTHGGWIDIGHHCSFNPNCVIYGHGGLRIGDGVRIAAGTVIIPANHEFNATDVPIMDQALTKKGIVIGDDVWIGANCVITDGVTIGSGTVIGAGSVVTRDIPARSVAVGAPAKVIRERGAA